jgi:4-hydroxy 2-oxovalerate aldolase
VSIAPPTPPADPARDVVLLDVTLRDGGFHNAWDFEPDLVRAYLKAMDEAKVDWAEIGYRSLVRKGFAGALRYTDEGYVDGLPPLKHTQLAAMLDAKELEGREAMIERLFAPADRSRIGLVRIATRPKDLATTFEQVERLADRGYLTTINLMAWASVPAAERQPLLERLARSKTDVVYIADSYGSMYPEEVFEAVSQWRSTIAGLGLSDAERPFGVHLHNNLELAFANALAAKKAGARWIDAAVLGMGRGPGNLKTEILLQHFEIRHRHPRFRTGPVYELISQSWERLHQQYGWGPRAPYVLSGHLAVHPTYAQDLLESGRYTISEVTAILIALHQAGTGRSYSRDALDEAISSRPTHLPTRRIDRPARGGTTEPSSPAMPIAYARLDEFRGKDWSNREVLIVGRGPSVAQHADAINRYIESFRPIVLECNHLREIRTSPDHLSCFIVLANAQRMLDEVLQAGKGVLFGVARKAAAQMPTDDPDAPIYVEPYEVAARDLNAQRCTIPADVVSMFALAQAVRHGAKKIRVVGFDGYEATRLPGPGAPPTVAPSARELRMQQELDEFFRLLRERYPAVEVVALTPTSFALEVRSIYGEVALGQEPDAAHDEGNPREARENQGLSA